MSDLGIGYWDHGVGALDPERYWPREVECARCGEPDYKSNMSDDYGDLICDECKEKMESPEMMIAFISGYERIIDFFEFLKDEAVESPETTKALCKRFLAYAGIGYEEWAISGIGRKL